MLIVSQIIGISNGYVSNSARVEIPTNIKAVQQLVMWYMQNNLCLIDSAFCDDICIIMRIVRYYDAVQMSSECNILITGYSAQDIS